MIALLITSALAATAAAPSRPATARVATAIDAERAFAADAARKGQWTAFRDWADPTAVMFEPQAVWVQQALKGRKDPPRSVQWAPTVSYTSCDGRTALNTGAWRAPGSAAAGTFATIWMKQASGDWRWIMDTGTTGKAAMTSRPRTERASCANRAAAKRALAESATATAALTRPPGDAGQGRSADGTIAYRWIVTPKGARRITVRQWTGRAYRVVLDQRIAANGRLAKPGT
jgi:hypothetical protein